MKAEGLLTRFPSLWANKELFQPCSTQWSIMGFCHHPSDRSPCSWMWQSVVCGLFMKEIVDAVFVNQSFGLLLQKVNHLLQLQLLGLMRWQLLWRRWETHHKHQHWGPSLLPYLTYSLLMKGIPSPPSCFLFVLKGIASLIGSPPDVYYNIVCSFCAFSSFTC